MYLAFHWRTSSLIYFLHKKPHTTTTSGTFSMPSLLWAIIDGLRPSPHWSTRTIVNDSQTGVACPQGTARWEIERILFVNACVFGKGSLTAFADDPPPGINEPSPSPA